MAVEWELRKRMAAALDLDDAASVSLHGAGTLDSAYPVSELAAATVATAALAAADLRAALGHPTDEIAVDRRLVDSWFGYALTPIGWTLPSPWDAIAGDYATTDGWVRLHTNAPHHRSAALRVLGVDADRDHVAAVVAGWSGDELEAAVVAEGGCAAVLRSPAEWAVHEQGAAVVQEPLVAWTATDRVISTDGNWPTDSNWRPTASRPLAGLRVLDLTRVLSGPVATRLLAGLGADVLRIDPPEWDEPAVVPEMTLGKRTAHLDARDPAGHDRLVALLAKADVVVHGYRADALDRLGLGDAIRRAVRPGIVDVSLDAYGHTGPWHARRGFDSLVQMSSGIAGSGIRSGLSEVPTPLPVQALDHGTGYLAAAAVLRGLAVRVRTGQGSISRLSLARTAVELENAARYERGSVYAPRAGQHGVADHGLADAVAWQEAEIVTPWGAATLLPAPFSLTGVTVAWERAPRPLGSDAPVW